MRQSDFSKGFQAAVSQVQSIIDGSANRSPDVIDEIEIWAMNNRLVSTQYRGYTIVKEGNGYSIYLSLTGEWIETIVPELANRRLDYIHSEIDERMAR